MNNDIVVLKSNKYGLSLQLDKQAEFEEIVKKICEIFAKNRAFFGEKEMVLETLGRDISFEESQIIIEAIQLNSDIKITFLNENNELKDLRMKDMQDRFYTDNIFENAKIIRGSIKGEHKCSSDSSIIILGDVKKKASVRARGNVIVFGVIEGTVEAGYPDNSGCYIVAGEIDSSNLHIGNISGEITIKDRWFSRTKRSDSDPVAIVVWNNELLCEPLRGGLLKKV